MRHDHAPHTELRAEYSPPPPQRRLQRWRMWMYTPGTLLAGLAALGWLLLRSGTKPGRLSYPCQQAAFSTASLLFGAPAVAALLAGRHWVIRVMRPSIGRWAVATVVLVMALGAWGYLTHAGANDGPQVSPDRDYRAQLFQVTNCPQSAVGDHFPGVDNLFALMGRQGLHLYHSVGSSLLAGPDGIIASDDVVIIKINYQWPERGGTNTDVLRGLIRCIVDHPDGFTGQVVVCENSQFNSIDNFDRTTNNAEDHTLSPHDVVAGFQGQGYSVCHYDWTSIRNTQVTEYSAGNTSDGYIVHPYDVQLQGRVSYPKFRTSYGTYISLKYGIWDPATSTYDRQRLKFINVPVLKSHHATYGATVCVKHFMGVVSGNLSTNSHSSIARGILGALMGEIRIPDLNIIDCIWINANPNTGPQTAYSGATRRDELVASRDPVAADIWAVKNILIPAFVANGFSPPWPSPSADPDSPSSAFRTYLDASMNYIRAAGYNATNDLAQIDAYSWNGIGGDGDFNGDGGVTPADFPYFAVCLSGPALEPAPVPPVTSGDCLWAFDFNRDGDVDLADFAEFQAVFNVQ